MKVLLVVAASAVALAFASGASAAQPSKPGGPSAEPDVVKLTAAQAKRLGVPDAFLPGTKPLPGIDSVGLPSPTAVGPCGACINTCWVATGFRAGDDTTTGSYWENSNPVWCGNGAWITYADISRHWQSVSMWYSADGEAGPWFDGGCVGCSSIHFTVYGYFTWHPPFIPASHNTARLGIWLQAYGSAAYA